MTCPATPAAPHPHHRKAAGEASGLFPAGLPTNSFGGFLEAAEEEVEEGEAPAVPGERRGTALPMEARVKLLRRLVGSSPRGEGSSLAGLRVLGLGPSDLRPVLQAAAEHVGLSAKRSKQGVHAHNGHQGLFVRCGADVRQHYSLLYPPTNSTLHNSWLLALYSSWHYIFGQGEVWSAAHLFAAPPPSGEGSAPPGRPGPPTLGEFCAEPRSHAGQHGANL